MFPYLLNAYMDAVVKEVRVGIGWVLVCRRLGFVLSRRKTSGQWWEVLLVCRRGLKANAGKSKVLTFNGEEGLECEIRVDRI